MTAFIAVLLTVLTFAFVTYPFLRRRSNSVGPVENNRLHRLHSERDTTYYMLKELEFDFQSGALTEEDYRDMEASYRKKAISILKDIDSLEKGADVDKEIEKQVLELRQSKGQFCPQCGAKVQEGDRFCSSCGVTLPQGGDVD